MAYSRTAAIVTVVAALTVVALSTQPLAGRRSTLLVAAAGSALVIFVIRANPEIADYTGTDGASLSLS